MGEVTAAGEGTSSGLAATLGLRPRRSSVDMLLALSDEAYGTEVEMSCGWCALPLSELCAPALRKDRLLRQPLMGGTPFAHADILSSDVSQRRSGWRAVTKMVAGRDSPQLIIKARPVTSMSSAERAAIATLPAPVVLPVASLPLVRVFREIQTAKLVAVKNGSVYDGPLRMFPVMITDPVIFSALRSHWAAAVRSLPWTKRHQLVAQEPRWRELIEALHVAYRTFRLQEERRGPGPQTHTYRERQKRAAQLAQLDVASMLQMESKSGLMAPFKVSDYMFPSS